MSIQRQLESTVVDDKDYQRYLTLCSEYLRRQMLVYNHWPQRRFHAMGYTDEKVFTDMNA